MADTILVVDTSVWCVQSVRNLVSPRYEVKHCGTAKDALAFAQQHRPVVVLCDYLLDDMTGIQLRRVLRSDRRSQNIPFILLSSSERDPGELNLEADLYLHKDDMARYLTHYIDASRHRPNKPEPPIRKVRASVVLEPDKDVISRLSGKVFYVRRGPSLDRNLFDNFSDWASGTPNPERWETEFVERGKEIFNFVFKTAELGHFYQVARGSETSPADIHLRFVGRRESLRFPAELIWDADVDSTGYLSLRHPMSRSIMGPTVDRSPLSQSLLRERGSNRALRILIIGSDPQFDLQDLDNDVVQLKAHIERVFSDAGYRPMVEMVRPAAASLGSVKTLLNDPQWDMIHYIGHGAYNAEDPENSWLPFFEERRGEPHAERLGLRSSDLRAIMEKSDVRFVYLQCCHGAQTDAAAGARTYSELGLADAFVEARVPAILIFRWQNYLQPMMTFAKNFYENVARRGDLDTALLEARRSEYQDRKGEQNKRWAQRPLWAAPILVLQS